MAKHGSKRGVPHTALQGEVEGLRSSPQRVSADRRCSLSCTWPLTSSSRCTMSSTLPPDTSGWRGSRAMCS